MKKILYLSLILTAFLTLVSKAQELAKQTAIETLRIEHEVAEGESVHKISKKYGVKMDDIRKWNSLKTDELKHTQVLVIYAEYHKEIHKVIDGESLYQIGILYGVKMAEIMKWNNLKDDKLHIGQDLSIFVLAHRVHLHNK